MSSEEPVPAVQPEGEARSDTEEFEARKRQRTELEQSDPYKELAPVDGADASEPAPSDLDPGAAPETDASAADGVTVASTPSAPAVPTGPATVTASVPVPPPQPNAASAAVTVPATMVGAPPQAGYGEVTTKVMLPNSKIGSVIGKGGTVIKQIRDSSGAKVNISETIAGNTERVIAITGDYTQVHTAFTMMLQNMVSQPGTPSQQITDPLTGQVISVQEQPSFTLLVPQSKAGGLIGKAGATINQIRTASGASVKVGNSNDLSPGPGMERSVTVSGPLEGCLQAHHMILVKLSEVKEARDASPRAGGGAGGGMAGGAVGGGGHARGGPGGGGGGGQQQYGMAYGGGMGTPAAAPMGGNYVPVQFQVPNEMMGAVIGKAGAAINEIRTMSGSDIKIGDNEPGNPMRLVTVTGSPEQIQLAQYLIQIKMGGGQLPSAQQFGMQQQMHAGMQQMQGMQQGMPVQQGMGVQQAMGMGMGVQQIPGQQMHTQMAVNGQMQMQQGQMPGQMPGY